MQVVVISDSHGDASAWVEVEKQLLTGAGLVIHAGDVLYHGPRNPIVAGYDPKRLAGLINASPVPVVIAKGNCDADVDQLLLDYPIQAPYTYLVLNERRIMVNHGAELDRDSMLALAKKFRVQVFISGHTHVPVLEKQEGIVFLNPGSCSLPKEGYPRTAAVMDGEGIVIYDIGLQQPIMKMDF